MIDSYNFLFQKEITPNNTIFNNFIDQIYYINLDNRIDRNIHTIQQLDKFKLTANRFSAFKGNRGLEARIACKKSHLYILKKAIRLSFKNICILEDDIIFANDFLDKANHCITNLPEDWDMLFLGHCFSSYGTRISKYLFCSQNIFCTHCYCVNKKAYFKIIDILQSNNKPIDHNYNYLSINKILNIYMCNPNIVSQIPNKSDIGEGPNNSNNLINND
jgi:GR25 family glycosyltransferase involved in LPS biosynthesis